MAGAGLRLPLLTPTPERIYCNGQPAWAHWLLGRWVCGSCGKTVKVVTTR